MWCDAVGGRTFEELRAKDLEPSRASYHSMISALRRDENWQAVRTVSFWTAVIPAPLLFFLLGVVFATASAHPAFVLILHPRETPGTSYEAARNGNTLVVEEKMFIFIYISGIYTPFGC